MTGRGGGAVEREPKGREYNTQQFYLNDTQPANFYYRNEIKDNFEATITETSVADHSITLCCEGRIECPKNTDVVFNTLFGNTTNHVAENETNSAHYACFDTILITLAHVDTYVFFVLNNVLILLFVECIEGFNMFIYTICRTSYS